MFEFVFMELQIAAEVEFNKYETKMLLDCSKSMSIKIQTLTRMNFFHVLYNQYQS